MTREQNWRNPHKIETRNHYEQGGTVQMQISHIYGGFLSKGILFPTIIPENLAPFIVACVEVIQTGSISSLKLYE